MSKLFVCLNLIVKLSELIMNAKSSINKTLENNCLTQRQILQLLIEMISRTSVVGKAIEVLIGVEQTGLVMSTVIELVSIKRRM